MSVYEHGHRPTAGGGTGEQGVTSQDGALTGGAAPSCDAARAAGRPASRLACGPVGRAGTRLSPTDAAQRVTATELFFDLVFVYAITQVTALVAGAPTALT